jgi:hypothetical protein
MPKRGFDLRFLAFGIRIWAAGGGWYYPATSELLAAVIVTLRKPLPSLYWEWRLWAGVRSGGWIGSAPGLKAGGGAAERGFWRVVGAATGGSRAQREEVKS